MRVGLEPMRDLAARLGDPQNSFRAIHVAGTKGKGSVSALIEAALAHAGLRVGRYASPHVERINERVSVQGHDVDEPALARALIGRSTPTRPHARPARPRPMRPGSTFSPPPPLSSFAKRDVEWAVIEVGLGGRLDFDQHRRWRNRNRHQHRARAYGNPWAHTRAAIAGRKGRNPQAGSRPRHHARRG